MSAANQASASQGDRRRRWAMALAVVGVVAFVALGLFIRRGPSQFDRSAIRAIGLATEVLAPNDRTWVMVLARDLTSLGSWPVLTLLVIGFFVAMVMANRRFAGWLLISAAATGWTAERLTKFLIDRARPDLVAHLDTVGRHSFPSGHTMLSAVVYLTLGGLVASQVSRGALKVFVICLSVLVTGLVGWSRVALGVHWPTDVIGGWLAGGTWALVCWLVATTARDRLGGEPFDPMGGQSSS